LTRGHHLLKWVETYLLKVHHWLLRLLLERGRILSWREERRLLAGLLTWWLKLLLLRHEIVHLLSLERHRLGHIHHIWSWVLRDKAQLLLVIMAPRLRNQSITQLHLLSPLLFDQFLFFLLLLPVFYIHQQLRELIFRHI
jgi:hypothetical protein